jgi:hypothetical protein
MRKLIDGEETYTNRKNIFSFLAGNNTKEYSNLCALSPSLGIQTILLHR